MLVVLDGAFHQTSEKQSLDNLPKKTQVNRKCVFQTTSQFSRA